MKTVFFIFLCVALCSAGDSSSDSGDDSSTDEDYSSSTENTACNVAPKQTPPASEDQTIFISTAGSRCDSHTHKYGHVHCVATTVITVIYEPVDPNTNDCSTCRQEDDANPDDPQCLRACGELRVYTTPTCDCELQNKDNFLNPNDKKTDDDEVRNKPLSTHDKPGILYNKHTRASYRVGQ